ncbi:MAG: hypothetical protein QOD98_4428 [Nocardioidaceae bacterium]|nr:hypothetical protein [Nocardioidaceae bacterium]
MTSQPGWHLDPVPPQSGQPAQLRYWDGARWTEHTAPAQPPSAGSQYAAPYAYIAGKSTTTPDGEPLAGWWQRVGASILDSFILLPLSALLWIPFYGKIVDAYRDYFDDVQRASDNGTSQPSPFTVQTELLGTFVLMGVISLVLSLVWTFFWLRWKQATPGKLILGLRIRLRETPGPLSWSTIGLRWLGQSGVGLLGLIPLVGSMSGIYSLLDALWPLWDDKRQAIHDKIAKTNVVRVR